MEVRLVAGNGSLGNGIRPASMRRAIEIKPHMIGCDAGSTDSGPAYLSAGVPKHSRAACKRDLRELLLARNEAGVPLIIGSCGTSGRDVGVEWMRDIAEEIAREEGLSFRLALIRSDLDRGMLKQRLAEGRVLPLNPAPPIDDAVIDASHIVGMMGAEPIIAAIEDGAEVILAGRASDAALYAAVAVQMGADPALAWHAAKTIECGASCCVVPRAEDGLIAYVRDDHFEIEPLNAEARVTPTSIAAHTLYENSNPFLLTEPSGVIDTEHAHYEALTDRTVKVSGTRFREPAKYTIKLEGAQPTGYQTVVIGGIRDPHLIGLLDTLIPEAQTGFDARIAELFGDQLKPGDYDIAFRLYGIDGVMGGLEPGLGPVQEVGVLITVTAPTQELASAIARFVSHRSAHLPAPGYEGLISSIAYPFSPPEIERGRAHRFTVNHVVVPDSPTELFRTELVEV